MKAFLAKIKEFWHKLFFWHTPMDGHSEFVPEMHHDHDLVLKVAPHKRSTVKQFKFFRRLLDSTERRVFSLSLFAFIVFALGGTAALIAPRISSVPAPGGMLTEALVGSPKLINPLFASLNDVDRDIATLVYSGLFRLDETLEPQPDLIERYSWSSDGKTLEVVLRSDAFFHDGVAVNASDVQFTYEAVKGAGWHSPLASNYKNIQSIIRVDDRTVQFQLDHPQPNILADLTLGILPAHLWSEVKDANATLAELNIKPIGSGPYHVHSFTRDNQGAIIKYRLESFSRYYGYKPLIQDWTFRFFLNRVEALAALKNGQVDALAFLPWKDVANSKIPSVQTVKLELPQQSVLFFNTKDSLLKDERLRSILVRSIDQQELQSLVGDHASLASSALPFLSIPPTTSTAPVTSTTSTLPLDLDTARLMLDKLGWVLKSGENIRSQAPVRPIATTTTRTTRTTATTATTSTTSTVSTPSSTVLAITIDTPNQADLVNLAELVKRRWSLLGVKVDIRIVPSEELFDQARGQKNYQAILWNILVPANQDISKFWNSADASPGLLNWSNLADRDIDHALELVGSATTTAGLQSARIELAKTINARFPALFLLRPTHAYLINQRVGGTQNIRISRPSDRLTQAFNWHVKTRWVWK